MSKDATAGLILAGVALVFFLIGRAIRGGAVWLIAGYRPDRVRDPADRELLARNVGGVCLFLAATVGAAAAALLSGVRAVSLAPWLSGAVVLALAAAAALEARRNLR